MIIKGDIDEIRYRNEENGFTIIVLDIDGEPVIATGVFPPVVEGQTVSVEGKYIVHQKYGRQFKAERVEIHRPAGVDGIVRYLGSGLIKGIGPALALRIVSYFGEKTFSVIENEPHLLSSVRGISENKAREIATAYGEIKEMQDAVMTLQSFNIPLGTAMKIYKQYEKNTVSVVTQNPYRLIEDIDGIGFITADRIALNAGIPRDSDFRKSAGIIFVLKESVSKSGNTCYPVESTIDEAAKLLSLSPQSIEEVAKMMVLERRIRPVVCEGVEAYMLPSVFRTEKSAAVLLSRLMDRADQTAFEVSGDIAHYEKVNGITLHENQTEAVKSAFNSGVVVVTGGPGTGKTTIIKCIIELFENLNKRVALMAPTGRAAKRMSEATNREAKTIHRACGFGKKLDGGCGESITEEVVIVDEFSMVDIFLFEALLKELPDGTRLVLVGDKDQLPSVGAGNVLSDLMNSGVIKTVKLNHIYRQAQESLIVTNAHAINHGEMPVLDAKDRDFFYLSSSSPEVIALKTVEMVRRIAGYLSVEPERVQVLCPMKNGVAGVISLNKALQENLNPVKGESLTEEEYTYAKGDKVMHIVNNYDIEWTQAVGYQVRRGSGIFNGDIGFVREVSRERGTIEVEFEDGRVATYTRDLFSQLMLAYAVTVHKSQGSEFDAVVMPICAGGPMLMTRNLLYTAITRAKRAVVLVGDKYYIRRMVENDYIATRYSLLRDFLLEAMKDKLMLYGMKKTEENG